MFSRKVLPSSGKVKVLGLKKNISCSELKKKEENHLFVTSLSSRYIVIIDQFPYKLLAWLPLYGLALPFFYGFEMVS